MVNWREVPTGDHRDFALELRKLIDDVAERRGLSTAGAFAELAGISASTLSEVARGKQLPSRPTMIKILRIAGTSTEDAESWLSRLDRPGQPVGAGEPTVATKVRQAASGWDAASPEESGYRPAGSLCEPQLLAELLTLVRDGQVSGLTDSDWAFVVASAVHHNARYRRWFDLAVAAGHATPVIEVLIEQVVGQYRRPMWRAAWLLQFAPTGVRRAAIRLIEDLAHQGDEHSETDPLFSGMLAAVDRRAVPQYLTTLPEQHLSTDMRRALLTEFRIENRPRSARGRLEAYINDSGGRSTEPAQPPTGALPALATQYLTTFKDFAFDVNRARIMLQTGNVDALVGVDGVLEGVQLQIGNLRRLPGINAPLLSCAEKICLSIESGSRDPKSPGDGGDRTLRDDLLAFDELCKQHIDALLGRLSNETGGP